MAAALDRWEPDRPKLSRPDFIVMGCVVNGGCMVIGSDQLTRAEVSLELEELSDRFTRSERFPVTDTSFTLSASVRAYQNALGATYADALRNLFASWAPETRRAIGGAR